MRTHGRHEYARIRWMEKEAGEESNGALLSRNVLHFLLCCGEHLPLKKRRRTNSLLQNHMAISLPLLEEILSLVEVFSLEFTPSGDLPCLPTGAMSDEQRREERGEAHSPAVGVCYADVLKGSVFEVICLEVEIERACA